MTKINNEIMDGLKRAFEQHFVNAKINYRYGNFYSADAQTYAGEHLRRIYLNCRDTNDCVMLLKVERYRYNDQLLFSSETEYVRVGLREIVHTLDRLIGEYSKKPYDRFRDKVSELREKSILTRRFDPKLAECQEYAAMVIATVIEEVDNEEN